MITPDWVRLMARYNVWQNSSIYAAAGGLTVAERMQNRRAFFGSIFATLNHILWADRIWLSRFAGTPAPKQSGIRDSVREEVNWSALHAARQEQDKVIIAWAAALTEADITGTLRWFSGAINAEVEKPRAQLFTHFFNHQTHHRGQVHAMLTAAGARPGPTDLAFMPETQ